VFSVLILTLNEERNLLPCLASIKGSDDIVVLDSGSTDRTVTMAEHAGARVYQHRFESFAAQRNHAQRTLAFRHPWVFHLDADEQLTPELERACRAAAARRDLDGYYTAPKMLWHGRWIPRCTDFPAWQARFVRAPQFEFIEVGHGQREAPAMRMAYLDAHYLHDLSSEGETAWLEKHRRYARIEARHHQAVQGTISGADLFSRNALHRRRALKHLSYQLPFRPALRLVYQYLLRGGFLEGAAGWQYCRLLARYERFSQEEMRALRR